jgi:hypothetical protein
MFWRGKSMFWKNKKINNLQLCAVVNSKERDPEHREETVAEFEEELFENKVVLVLDVCPVRLPVVEDLNVCVCVCVCVRERERERERERVDVLYTYT